MAGVVGALLRVGLAVKLGHLKQATAAYIDDRMSEGRATAAGYSIGAGFYAAAGIFAIATLLVGAAALFRWIEMKYGLFTAFGATAGALFVAMIVCAIIAAASMRRKKNNHPSLGSRLSVALHAAPPQTSAKSPTRPMAATAAPPGQLNPAKDHVASARNTATSVLRAPPAPRRSSASTTAPIVRTAGAASAIGLLGWALARRYSTPSAPPPVKRRHR